jgi:hypothetical protein
MAQKVEKSFFLCDIVQIGVNGIIIFLLKKSRFCLIYIY